VLALLVRKFLVDWMDIDLAKGDFNCVALFVAHEAVVDMHSVDPLGSNSLPVFNKNVSRIHIRTWMKLQVMIGRWGGGGALCSESSKAFEKSMLRNTHENFVHKAFRLWASG
jgi:hypothetical protein